MAFNQVAHDPGCSDAVIHIAFCQDEACMTASDYSMHLGKQMGL